MQSKVVLMILFCFLFFCCESLAIKKKLVGNYYLIAADSIDNCALCYHEEGDNNNYNVIVDAYVYAAGFNDQFIVVEQHPNSDVNITNYYILPRKNELNWGNLKELIGPLDEEQYIEKGKELSISENLKISVEVD